MVRYIELIISPQNIYIKYMGKNPNFNLYCADKLIIPELMNFSNYLDNSVTSNKSL